MFRTSLLIIAAIGLAACGGGDSVTGAEDDATGAEDGIAGSWVSVETLTPVCDESDGCVPGPLQVFIDPVTDPAMLTGSWSLATAFIGSITDAALAGDQLSLTLHHGCGNILLTGTLSASADAINGTLNGIFFCAIEEWNFDGTTVTLRRES